MDDADAPDYKEGAEIKTYLAPGTVNAYDLTDVVQRKDGRPQYEFVK